MEQRQIADRLAIIQAMADRLPEYLMGDKLYQQMRVDTPGGAEYTSLTPGALLENIQDLRRQAEALTDVQREQLAVIERKVEHDRDALAPQWRGLLRRELRALLDSWNWYLDDVGVSQRARDNYPSEVRLRTRIDLVGRAIGDDPEIRQDLVRLATLDSRLRAMLKPGAYVGPRGAAAQYPPTHFWWLHGRPVAKDDD